MESITSIRFKNYKVFKSFTLSLKTFNVLVGPNNSGKSTVLGALRILAEALRKAKSKNPDFVQFKSRTIRGYRVPLTDLPVSTENVFTNYDDTDPAEIVFRLSNGNSLTLAFDAPGSCYLLPQTRRGVRTVSEFKRQFDLSITSVPVLGPVEQNEILFGKEAARLALLTHRASRNIRNIWYHYPEHFDEFRAWIQRTWPGMDIKKPEVERHDGKPCLYMFCPEHRIDREIFWAGFGFQVWCQMLTFILQSRESSQLIIDEPDIYLHAELQRQLIQLLEELAPAIVLATHSTEIISEVEVENIVHISRKWRSAKRFSDSKQLHDIFLTLGSRLNPALTQLARTRVVLFLEGQDFKILSKFARKLGLHNVANQTGFAIIPSQGFNPQKVIALVQGMELSLGFTLSKAVIFDRDYRCDAEIEEIWRVLENKFDLVTIHDCKEIENYLLRPEPLAREITHRIKAAGRRN